MDPVCPLHAHVMVTGGTSGSTHDVNFYTTTENETNICNTPVILTEITQLSSFCYLVMEYQL